MKKIVIDTNVIVSAILSPKGIPARIIDLVSVDENLQLYYSESILAEYERVFVYKRLNIPITARYNIITTIQLFGILVEPTVSTLYLPDESDRIFYDATIASGAYLITGNIKHFPSEPFIMTPSIFIKKLYDN